MLGDRGVEVDALAGDRALLGLAQALPRLHARAHL
jgi:hypothetical protein